MKAEFSLAVLNPNGRDRFVDYTHGPGKYRSGNHPPINYHAYAAATRGAFFDKTQDVLDAPAGRFDAVLVLIRRKVSLSLEAVKKLKAAKKTVIVAWKESGPYQIGEQLDRPAVLADYSEILALADGILSPTLVKPPRWGWVPAREFYKKSRFIPTPYPLEFEEWDYSIAPEKQTSGILVGTREFFAPTRNHPRALARAADLADRCGVRVTMINSDKRKGRQMIRQMEESFPEGRTNVIWNPLPYDQYLKLIAKHRLVFQLDRSGVPGQVAGDSLLCRTLCAGGNSAIEKVVFPELCDDASGTLEVVYERIVRLLRNDAYRAEALQASQALAMEKVSFGAVAKQLAEFHESIR